MIPYVTLPPIFLGPWVVQPFAVLVCFGILVAHFILVARAGGAGLERGWAAEMSLAMVVCGFAGAVAFKAFYRPDLLASAGWLGAVRTVPGISSFGGLFGALAAAAAYLAVRRVAPRLRLAYLDCAAFAFPFGFAFGRLGCFLAHDHPGRRSDSGLLTVAYPDGARFDLAVYEFLFLAALAAAFVWLRLAMTRGRFPSRDREGAVSQPIFSRTLRERPPGVFLALLLVGYGLFRAALDRLHVDPPRYAGLSVDVWSGCAAAVAGLFVWRYSRRLGPL